MRLNTLDLSPHGETLIAVVVGALLATVSGVAANQLESHFRRRERERTAALLFGEVFSTLRILLEGAERARHIGEPYGPFTRRMLYAARREIDIYERNRESLLDLRDAGLRVDVHASILRIAMPLDAVIDSLASPGADPGAADGDSRNRSFQFVVEGLAQLQALVARLGRIAGHHFDQHYDRIPRPGAPAA